MEAQPEITQNISLLKLPMLKTGDCDLWSMRMEQYLTHTNYGLWEVIINGDSPVLEPPVVGTVVPSKTEAQKLARKNELKAKSTLLLVIPDEHLLKFHSIKDAKSLWEAIKTRFGWNKESKKMHKTILKQQYENFEDANIKLLRSLPPAKNNIALIMINKPDIETLSMDDLYNNLKNTISINEIVNAAHDIPTVGSKEQPSASNYADDVMFSFFACQSNTLQLDNEDLEQIDTDDLEEMDLKWQVAMITMRVKRFIKKTGRNLRFNGKELVGFDKTRVECFNCHRRGYFSRECRVPRNQGNRGGDNERRIVPVETPASALVVQDGLGGYDWSYQAEEGPTDFALMAHSSDSSNSEVQSCSNECLQSFKNLQKQYDQQKKILNKANLEILDLKNQLEEAIKEKDDLKEKLTNVSEIDEDNNQTKDRYKVGIGYHTVPHPYTGNYMPPRANISFAGLYDSVFKFKISETRTSVNENESIASKSSEEIREEPKTVRSSAPIIEDWEYDFEDECVDKSSTEQDKSSNDNSVKLNESKTNTFSRKFNTAKGKNVTIAGPKVAVNAAEGNKENAVKSSACWTWRPKGKLIDHTSKNSGSYTLKRFNYVDPNGRLKSDQGIFDSGCSRYMTSDKSFITEYQKIDGGFVAFRGSPKRDFKLLDEC
nr:hypothetical protein [Tanacetum cinerariifolium]